MSTGASLESFRLGTGFRLEKWYLDCVTNQGDALIAYTAQLRAGVARASYASILEFRNGRISEHTSMRGFASPIGGDTVQVDLPRLELCGQWKAVAPSISSTVFETETGSVEWQCLQPRSQVAAQVGGREVGGVGYAECLTLTIPPWSLPLQRLYWGRFHSPTETVVWIDWAGGHNRRLVFRAGQPCECVSISRDKLEFANGSTLELNCERTLRSGVLGDTIVPAAPILTKWFPNSMLAIAETKWLSEGVFRAGKKEEQGWSIHEVVEWKC